MSSILTQQCCTTASRAEQAVQSTLNFIYSDKLNVNYPLMSTTFALSKLADVYVQCVLDAFAIPCLHLVVIIASKNTLVQRQITSLKNPTYALLDVKHCKMQ